MKVTVVIGAFGKIPETLIKGQEDLEIRGQLNSISKIGQNTEKSPGDLRNLLSNSCEKPSANAGVKNSQRSNKK